MRRLKQTLVGALAVTFTVGLMAGQAAAEDNLDLGEMAAALAFPIITGDQTSNKLKLTEGDVVIDSRTATTLITVTNGKSDPIILKVDLISGDGATSGDQWQSLSLKCPLSGRETTTFVIRDAANEGTSELYVECTQDGNDPVDDPTNVRRFTNVQNGIMFVAVADPASDNKVVSEDVIFGDAIVIDPEHNQAYSFAGIPFQAGENGNNGDKVYQFDGEEYAKWPAVLATNFLAPTESVNAELILFTLDGATGSIPTPRVRLGGLGFNDDEEYFNFQYEFDCFDVVSLTDLDPNFKFTTRTSLGLGSVSGHLTLKAQSVGTLEHDSHDVAFGNSDNVRKRPAHCWIVQNTDGTFMPEDEPIPGAPVGTLSDDGQVDDDQYAAWGRPCMQSRSSLRPNSGDMDPVLDANASH